MKIGAVCEQTGLTDRTVRFYTDEGLLNPNYTKNYLGRKNYDFSEDDVVMLSHIAVLRKYGFSIQEIKSILEDPAQSVEIIETLRKKKQDSIRSEQELLDGLLTLEAGREYTVPELAQALHTPKLESKELLKEGDESCLTVVCQSLFWLMCVPAICSVLYLTFYARMEWSGVFLHVKRHPWFSSWVCCMAGIYLIPLLGAGAMIALECLRRRMDNTIRQLAIIVVFIVYALFGNIGFVISAVYSGMLGIYSETEDPADYMVLGSMEEETLGSALEFLFPDQIPDYALGEYGQPTPDTTCYYNFVDKSWDSSFELYAQWKLTKNDLQYEKERIRAELDQQITAEGQFGDWEYWSIGMDPALWMDTPPNHVWESHERSCLFFAYNDKSGMVRYIASYSDNYASEPGFCSLDWD